MEWETAFKRIEELEKIVSALEVRLDRQYELTKEILHRFDILSADWVPGRLLPPQVRV